MFSQVYGHKNTKLKIRNKYSRNRKYNTFEIMPMNSHAVETKGKEKKGRAKFAARSSNKPTKLMHNNLPFINDIASFNYFFTLTSVC